MAQGPEVEGGLWHEGLDPDEALAKVLGVAVAIAALHVAAAQHEIEPVPPLSGGEEPFGAELARPGAEARRRQGHDLVIARAVGLHVLEEVAEAARLNVDGAEQAGANEPAVADREAADQTVVGVDARPGGPVLAEEHPNGIARRQVVSAGVDVRLLPVVAVLLSTPEARQPRIAGEVEARECSEAGVDVLHGEQVVDAEDAGAEPDTQLARNHRILAVHLRIQGIERAVREHGADQRLVAGHAQMEVRDPRGRGKRIGLGADPDVDVGPGGDTAVEAGLLVEIEPVDADIAGLGGTEAACAVGAVEPHALIADRGAEGILGRRQGVLAGPLGVRRAGPDQDQPSHG